jgi:membrane associated rhomboid family serine protease
MLGGEILLLVLLVGLAGVLLAALAAPLIPVRRRASSSFPIVTLGLIVLNLFLFAVTSQRGVLTDEVARGWGLTPRDASLVTLLTATFLHGSWMHLGGNMLGLLLFGPHVEEALGRLEYLLFYIGCGVAAGLLHVVISATLLPAAAAVPMVGASGALFGVLGLFAVRFYRAHVRVFLVAPLPAVWAVSGFAVLQVIWGLLSLGHGARADSTANWAHVGGFLFGMLLAVPLRMREDAKREYRLEDAQTAVDAGRLDQAAAFYRLALGEKPDDAVTHRALARVCVRQGHTEAAHRHFTDALRFLLRVGNAPAVADLYEEIGRSFRTFPLPPSLLYRTACACEAAHRFPPALRALGELCRDYPTAFEAELALLRMGKLHLGKMDQPESAAGILEEFLRLYPASEWRSHVERLLREARQAQHPGPVPAAQG